MEPEELSLSLRTNIIFYPEFGLMKCGLCQTPTILRKGFAGHMRHHHQQRLQPSDVRQVLARFWNAQSLYFQSSRLLLPPIPFLPVLPGFACQSCIYYCTLKTIMNEHYRRKHPGISIGLVACKVQSVASKPIKKYIGVEDVSNAQDPPPVEATPAASLRDSMLRVLREPVQPMALEVAQVPRLITNLGWDGILSSEQRQVLLQYPEREGQPKWSSFKAIKGFFLQSMDYINTFDNRIKLLLRDDCHGFRKLQEQTSKERYVLFMARFIWFAMTCQSEESVTLTVDLEERLRQFEGHLCDIETTDSLEDSLDDPNGIWAGMLLDVLESILVSRPPSMSSCDLVPMFVRLNCQKEDGTIPSIDNITHACSIVPFYFRLAFT